jgi:hypothetical protein
VRYWIEKLLICALFGGLYLLLFRLSSTLNLVDSYAPGISLVFLPAGVKLVAALTSGAWGVLGTVLALAFVTPEFWPNEPAWFYVLYPSLSGFSTLAMVVLMKRLLHIHDDLHGLRLLHVPVIDLFSTVFHGAVVNGLFVWLDMPLGHEFLTRALAMSVGDFVGSLILLLAFVLGFKVYEAKRVITQP